MLATIVLLVVIHTVAGGRQVVMLTASGMLLPGVNSSVQAVVLLGIAAVEINLSLFFFNLLPIPPLDGSHLLRNILPYNAVQILRPDSHVGKLVLMIFVGGYIMRLLLLSGFRGVGLVLSKG